MRCFKPCARGAVPAIALAMLAACVEVGPDFHPPHEPVPPHWRRLPANPTEVAGPVDARNWWLKFHDERLTRLLTLALHDSPTLAAAGQRILQAQAELSYLLGQRYPQQQYLSGDAAHVRQSVHGPTYLPGSPVDFNEAQIGLTVAWEADFWGLYRRAIESGRAGLAESEAGYGAAKVILTAQVASAYVTLRTDQALVRVARENIAAQSEGLRIAQARYHYGENSELDVRQATSQLRTTRAELPSLQTNVTEAIDAIAVLVGEPPVELDSLLSRPAAIPRIDPRIAVGIPRDVLRDRPDVREAELAAAAQSAQIGVAKAALYPSFTLGGTFGLLTSDVKRSSLSDLFLWDSRMLQVGPSFLLPLFNYGRLEAQVRVQNALFRQALLNYQNVVLQAQQEVEDARELLANALATVSQLIAADAAARRATELSLIQYRQGEVSYTTVLTAQQTQLSVQRQLESARGAVPQAVIALYRALGGGWH